MWNLPVIRGRNPIRYTTHLQQIKLLKRLLPVRIPQLVLRTWFMYLLCSSHSESPLGQVEPFQRVCEKLCACAHTWMRKQPGRRFWVSERICLLTLANPFMRGRLFPLEAFPFLPYRIWFSVGLFDILWWQLIKLVELEGTREILKCHSVVQAVRKLRHRAWY